MLTAFSSGFCSSIFDRPFDYSFLHQLLLICLIKFYTDYSPCSQFIKITLYLNRFLQSIRYAPQSAPEQMRSGLETETSNYQFFSLRTIRHLLFHRKQCVRAQGVFLSSRNKRSTIALQIAIWTTWTTGNNRVPFLYSRCSHPKPTA